MRRVKLRIKNKIITTILLLSVSTFIFILLSYATVATFIGTMENRFIAYMISALFVGYLLSCCYFIKSFYNFLYDKNTFVKNRKK